MNATPESGFLTIADVTIDALRPSGRGFVLQGRGQDAADYELEMHLDLPVDERTRSVLGELLVQSAWRVRRRVRTPLRRRAGARSRTESS